jgi:hypothetical protein
MYGGATEIGGSSFLPRAEVYADRQMISETMRRIQIQFLQVAYCLNEQGQISFVELFTDCATKYHRLVMQIEISTIQFSHLAGLPNDNDKSSWNRKNSTFYAVSENVVGS